MVGVAEKYFGVPGFVVYYVSVLAFSLAFYSGSVYFFVKRKLKLLLKILAVCNLLYCCLTVAIVVYFFHKLSAIGMIYFISEVLVVICLVMLELKIARKLQSDQEKLQAESP